MQEFLDLSPAKQEQLLDRLTDHALCKMRKLTWRGARVARGGSVPGGYEPYDLALEALADALAGEDRNWNRAKYATVEAFLRSVVDSKISNLVRLAENRSERRMPEPPSKDGETVRFDVPGTERDPLVLLIDREWKQRFHEAAMKELEGDEFLTQIVDCMEAEITKPLEIAEALRTKEKQLSVDDVNNALKRLERKLKKLDTRIKPAKKGKP